MPGFVREHLRPLAGSAALHVALFAAAAGFALRWTSPPPVELAIEGYLTELAVPARPTAAPRAAAPPPSQSAPAAVPQSAPPPTPAAETVERRVEELQAEREAANARAERERTRAAEQAQADAVERQQAEQAQRRAAEEQARRKAEAAAVQRKAEQDAAEAKRKAAEEQARRETAAAEARRQAAADAKAQSEREAREADLQRRLAAEEDEAAFARSGVVDEYRALLVQTIERSWIRPPTARAGLQCTLFVTQAPGGTVIDVQLGACNGDQAVRESISNAVYRASPLPAPRDPRAFQRRLEIVFRPTE
jgi:colicin import membrane protein